MLPMEKLLIKPDLHWMIEDNSPAEDDSMFAGLDVPITSNVATFPGNYSGVITLTDLYRPAPYLEIR